MGLFCSRQKGSIPVKSFVKVSFVTKKPRFLGPFCYEVSAYLVRHPEGNQNGQSPVPAGMNMPVPPHPPPGRLLFHPGARGPEQESMPPPLSSVADAVIEWLARSPVRLYESITPCEAPSTVTPERRNPLNAPKVKVCTAEVRTTTLPEGEMVAPVPALAVTVELAKLIKGTASMAMPTKSPIILRMRKVVRA